MATNAWNCAEFEIIVKSFNASIKNAKVRVNFSGEKFAITKPEKIPEADCTAFQSVLQELDEAVDRVFKDIARLDKQNVLEDLSEKAISQEIIKLKRAFV